MINLATRPVLARECLFVLGLPLRKEEWIATLRYPRSYASQHLGPDPEGAWDRASRFVELSLQKIEVIKELGAAVLLSPSIADLMATAPDYVVVILFTHALWEPIDLPHIKDPAGLVKELMFGTNVASASFLAWLDLTVLSKLPSAGDVTSKAILEALGDACRYAHDWWAVEAIEAGKRPVLDLRSVEGAVTQNLCRPEIDRQFASYVECDRGIEFGGRMCGLTELFGGLAANGRRRIFDLSMCNSAMTANSIKQLCPGSLIAINEWLRDPAEALLRCISVLRELLHQPCSYPEAYRRFFRRIF